MGSADKGGRAGRGHLQAGAAQIGIVGLNIVRDTPSWNGDRSGPARAGAVNHKLDICGAPGGIAHREIMRGIGREA